MGVEGEGCGLRRLFFAVRFMLWYNISDETERSFFVGLILEDTL